MATFSSTLAKENWWDEVRAVFVKDVRSEWRTRSAVSTLLFFSVATMLLISITVETRGLGLTMGLREDPAAAIARGETIFFTAHTAARARLLSALYWIILFFSAMAGLPRVFVKEEEMRTAPALRLAARPSAVFTGKLLFNLALMEGVTLLLLPLFLMLFEPRIASWPLFLAHLLIGAAALAGTSTILGAIVARAANRGYLMLVLGFGPLLPVLGFAILGTAAAMHGDTGNNLLGLVSYLGIMTVVSGWLFDRVWSDS